MVVLGLAWLAIAWASYMVPPFLRKAVMPVARNVWLQAASEFGSPPFSCRRNKARRPSGYPRE